MTSMTAQALITEGLNDYSDELEDAVLPGLIVALAAQEPAWIRQARREMAEYDDFDWGYEDWKWERDFAQAEREYEEAMTRLDDDGAPAHDWQAW